jgi:hypothetical protein
MRAGQIAADFPQKRRYTAQTFFPGFPLTASHSITQDFIKTIAINNAIKTCIASFMTQHIKISEALACLRAARLRLYRVCDLATEILAPGRLSNDEERTPFRSEAAFAGRMFTQAVNIVWDAGGAL